jgi:hypothetical protein
VDPQHQSDWSKISPVPRLLPAGRIEQDQSDNPSPSSLYWQLVDSRNDPCGSYHTNESQHERLYCDTKDLLELRFCLPVAP